MKIRILLSILISLLLTGCGFQLRSDNSLPLPLRVLYLQSSEPYSQFTANLKKSLEAVGVTLVDSPAIAPATLEILQTSLTYPASSSGTSSQATVYIVTYQALVALNDAKGNTIIPAQNVSASTNMIVNAQQPVSSTNQIDTLTRQLQREVIIKIFDLLSSPQAHEAVNSPAVKKTVKHHKKHENHPRPTHTST